MSLKVEQTITVYEVDGERIEHQIVPFLDLKISSHIVHTRDWVVLEIGDHRYTVSANDLIPAIENARRAQR